MKKALIVIGLVLATLGLAAFLAWQAFKGFGERFAEGLDRVPKNLGVDKR